MDYIGSFLKGADGRKIALTLWGNAGDNYGAHAKDACFRNNGDIAQHCGSAAARSEFICSGLIGYACGENTWGCSFEAVKIGNDCGRYSQEGSRFTAKDIGGDPALYARDCIFEAETFGRKCGMQSMHCTYKSSRLETIAQLLEEVPMDNTLVLAQGSIELIVPHPPIKIRR